MTVSGDFKSEIANSRRKVAGWKELREWKDIITSYIEMKNTIDQLDMFNDVSAEIPPFLDSRSVSSTEDTAPKSKD